MKAKPSHAAVVSTQALCAAARRRAILAALFVGLGLAAPSGALAQATPRPPERMTYQGFLVDGNGAARGNPSARNYDVIFRIYNGPTGGTGLLWGEQQTVTVDKGYFSVLLGEGASTGDPRPALPTLFKGPTASDRYVAITVKGIGPGGANVDIQPRLRLLSAPYAFLAENATKLVRPDTTADLITANANAVTVSGTLSADQLSAPVINGTTINTTTLRATNLIAGSFTANNLSGDGSGLSGVAKLSGGNTFSGNQILNNALGIGTAPSFPLHTATAVHPVANFQSSSTLGTWLGLQNTSVGGGTWQFISSGSGNGEGAGKLLLGSGPTLGGITSGVLMTAQANGNIGFGTTSPGMRVDVNGGVGISGANVLEFGRGLSKQTDAGKIGYGTFAAGALNIVGAGASGTDRRVYIYSEGGTTVAGPMNVSGMSTAPSFRTVSGSRYAEFFRSFNYMAFDVVGGTGQGGSATRTVVYDGDSNWDFNSDRRLKKDIVDAESMLERALKLSIRRYRWKDEDATSKHKLGVIAQEVQPLFPDLVSENELPGRSEKTLMVGYSDFGLVAIKALQELKSDHDREVAALKSEIATLKSQMAEVLQAAAEIRGQRDAAAKAKETAGAGR